MESDYQLLPRSERCGDDWSRAVPFQILKKLSISQLRVFQLGEYGPKGTLSLEKTVYSGNGYASTPLAEPKVVSNIGV
jgi:hypothetical protein